MDAKSEANEIVFNFMLDHDITVKRVEGRGPGDRRPLVKQIEDALHHARQEAIEECIKIVEETQMEEAKRISQKLKGME